VSVISNKKFRFGIVSGLIGCFLSWLLLSDPKPLNIDIPILEELWIVLNIPLHLILMAINLPKYLENFASYILIFIQWFFVGWLICSLIAKLRFKSKG
jgi:hypothetical protein